jgi:DNA polymerase-3 subunit gamma/tau
LRAQAERVDRAVVVRLLELLGEAMEGARAGADPRTRLELALVKAARPALDASTGALLARIERLERERGASAVAADRVVPAGERHGPVGETPSPGSDDQVPTHRAPAAPAPVSAGPQPSAGDADAHSTPAPAMQGASAVTPVADAARGTTPVVGMTHEAAEVGGAPTPAVPETAGPATDIASERAVVTEMPHESAPVAGIASERAMVADVAGEPAPGAITATDLESLRALWPAVVDVVRAGNALIGALIADARPAAVDGEDLMVAFASSAAFLKKKAEHPDNRAIVTDALRQVTGGRWRLSYELLEVDADPSPEQRTPTEEEWVRRFMEEFDAEELLNESAPAGGAAPDGAMQDGAAPDRAMQDGAMQDGVAQDGAVSVNSESKEA